MLSSQTSYHFSHPIQEPFDAAVVIPTLCRPSLLRAATSVFRQAGVRRLQLLIGIDVVRGDTSIIDAVLAARPAPHAVTVLNLGYSTSKRHGGVHEAGDSGALRTILTYCANSRYVTYLDDDNWIDESHIARLLKANEDKDWAYTLRWFVDPDTLRPLGIDRWESVGPGRGVFGEVYGGFVDPNCLMIDKVRCDSAVRFWATPLPGEMRRLTADRSVFDILRRSAHVGFTNAATAFYVLNPSDANNVARMKWIRAERQQEGTASPSDPH
ncbi:MAG: hypothetical protein ACREFI_05320, partial [Stellaceae bacterium]